MKEQTKPTPERQRAHFWSKRDVLPFALSPSQGRMIAPEEAMPRSAGDQVCPACGRGVRVFGGKSRPPHFVHPPHVHGERPCRRGALESVRRWIVQGRMRLQTLALPAVEAGEIAGFRAYSEVVRDAEVVEVMDHGEPEGEGLFGVSVKSGDGAATDLLVELIGSGADVAPIVEGGSRPILELSVGPLWDLARTQADLSAGLFEALNSGASAGNWRRHKLLPGAKAALHARMVEVYEESDRNRELGAHWFGCSNCATRSANLLGLAGDEAEYICELCGNRGLVLLGKAEESRITNTLERFEPWDRVSRVDASGGCGGHDVADGKPFDPVGQWLRDLRAKEAPPHRSMRASWRDSVDDANGGAPNKRQSTRAR